MRISDWSSDVCSSDLIERERAARLHLGIDPALPLHIADHRHMIREHAPETRIFQQARALLRRDRRGVGRDGEVHGTRRGDRKSVGEGKSVDGRLELGGRRIIKKKNKYSTIKEN